jgi:hypothetical protein
MVESAVSTELVKTESPAPVVKLLPAKTAKSQSMGMVDQGFWCIGHPKAATKPAFAEFSVLCRRMRKEGIKTARAMEAVCRQR